MKLQLYFEDQATYIISKVDDIYKMPCAELELFQLSPPCELLTGFSKSCIRV